MKFLTATILSTAMLTMAPACWAQPTERPEHADHGTRGEEFQTEVAHGYRAGVGIADRNERAIANHNQNTDDRLDRTRSDYERLQEEKQYERTHRDGYDRPEHHEHVDRPERRDPPEPRERPDRGSRD